MELDKAIIKRKSVKKFSKRKPDWRNIIEAIDMAKYSPMAGNLFSLKFIVVNDQEKIKELSKISQQDFVSDADYVVVVCSSSSRTLNSYEEKGEIYLRQQAGAAIQNFLLKLTDLGLSTCWIGYFVEDNVKKLLKIPKEMNVEAFFPIGYESQISKGKQKRKIAVENVLYFEEYGKSRMSK